METVLYSKFIDKRKYQHLPCFHCGKEIPEQCEKKYIFEKRKYSTVMPTCGIEECLDCHKKWNHQKTRNVNAKWKH